MWEQSAQGSSEPHAGAFVLVPEAVKGFGWWLVQQLLASPGALVPISTRALLGMCGELLDQGKMTSESPWEQLKSSRNEAGKSPAPAGGRACAVLHFPRALGLKKPADVWEPPLFQEGCCSRILAAQGSPLGAAALSPRGQG